MRELMLLRTDLSEAEAELNDIYTMSEEAACFRYLCDTKNEAIHILEESIEEITHKIELLEEQNNEEYKNWCDPAFRSEADFYRMRI